MARAKRKTNPEETPSIEPPAVIGAAGAEEEAPTALAELMAVEAAPVTEAGPTLSPPDEPATTAAEEVGVTAWHNNKKITALWCTDGTRNAWIAIGGLGWKRLANTHDSAVVNMTMLAAHAEQTGANVNVRIEADGMVHELYVW